MPKNHFLNWSKRRLTARRLRKTRIPELRWRDAIAQAGLLQQLTHDEQHRLREMASRFLQTKAFSGAGGLEVTELMRDLIAAQACLLILELDMSYFDGWQEIIIYPQPFIVRRDVTDSAGLVHEMQQVLGGEAWGRGPVILSWSDIEPEMASYRYGSNVILHEFAHKLDMLNGDANGMPPLHASMQRETWTQVFAQAYEKLNLQLASYHHASIDPYAAENPAEFFAVTTECFFEAPQRLHQAYPDVYAQMRLFYRQDPLSRVSDRF